MIDSHCHLNDKAFDGDLEEVVSKAQENGINKILVLGWDYESSLSALEMANKHDGIYAAVGVHPENIGEKDLSLLKDIKALAKDKKVIAIGEIGLDYYWEKDPLIHQRQRDWFIKQIELANELGLPCSIHCREAVQDTYDILKEHPVKKGAVLHCYSGSLEMMKRFIDLDLYFGFDGPITYKNAIVPKECCAYCPKDRILTETDSPYLPPVPYRGKRNEPSYIKEIITQMALLRGKEASEMERQINENFSRLFSV